MTTILLTDEAKVHGSQWLADLPIRAGTQTAAELRNIQGVRAPITIGPFHAEDAIVVLANVADGVETWRVYKAAPGSVVAAYAVGDTIEVIERPGGYDYGPSVGHRAVVVEISDFNTLCIPWDEEFDGFWLSYDQVRRVDEQTT